MQSGFTGHGADTVHQVADVEGIEVQDLVPGPLGSYPMNLGVINGKVIVAASVPEVGRELFLFPSFGAQAEETPGPPVALSRGLPQLVVNVAPSPQRIIDLLEDAAGQQIGE